SSEGYEKIKTQNYLREEDVEKIIDTYKSRATIDKYSYVAKLVEVKENDYNLNIPRYVDTSDEEDPVDLEAVASELKILENDIKATDAEIADFCKQLGIEQPF